VDIQRSVEFAATVFDAINGLGGSQNQPDFLLRGQLEGMREPWHIVPRGQEPLPDHHFYFPGSEKKRSSCFLIIRPEFLLLFFARRETSVLISAETRRILVCVGSP
jgi:hypothetical protein